MTMVGILMGIITGCLITLYFQVNGIHIPGSTELLREYGLPERMYPQLSLLSVSMGPAVVLLITLLTALFPALKVRRLKPVEAMQAV
jgi:ABC-type lipoprotein release transport system permease subunit